MLSSKLLGAEIGISERYAQMLTKISLEQGKSFIEHKGQRFTFQQVAGIGGRGKVYAYAPITTPKLPTNKPRRRVPTASTANPADLPEIANFNKPSAKEKLAVITFCTTSKLPYGLIAKCLISKYEAFNSTPSSFETKIKRWTKAFKQGGINALEDKRGGRRAMVDLERVKQVVYACGTKHYNTQFTHYCYLYSKDNGLRVNLRNPSADIHYTTFVRSVERLKKYRTPIYCTTMLRIHCLQQWYSLSDPAMEDALYEIYSIRLFSRLSLSKPIPDHTTVMNFRHLI